jgi:hypothetical protein
MTVILYGILLAHLNSYKEYYGRIFVTFAVTYLMKRLIKVSGQKEHSELIGLGGYSLTIGEFIKLIGAVKHNGMTVQSEEANKIIGGVLGRGLDSLIELFKK